MPTPDTTPSPEVDAFFLPPRIAGYDIVGLLGEGGMGTVYRARELHPPRDVALKLMRGLGLDSRQRFRREAELLAALEHPGIARLYAAGEADFAGARMPWLALEYVRGTDLVSHADAAGLDLPSRLRLLIPVCRAVHHAHSRGVIHRDLKPANILVDDTGQPKVLDFGIARLRDEASAVTQAGQVLGTLPYMSPEQLSGGESSVQTDVYSLGVIAYELIARRLPHPRLSTSTLFEALDIVRHETPPPLGAVAARARGDLERVVMKALASEPERRYDSCAAFAADLERVLDHRPVEARAPSAGYIAARFVRRHRALTAAAGIVLVALLAAATVSWLSAREARAALAEAQARAQELAAVNGFVERMLTEADPELGGSPEMPLRDVLERSVVTLDAMRDEPRTAGQIALLLARTWSGLGDGARAQPLFERARVELARGFGDGAHEVHEARLGQIEALSRGGDPQAAAKAATELAATLSALDAPWSDDLHFRARVVLAQAMEEAGDVEAAIVLARELLADPQLARLQDRAEVTDVLRHNLAYALLNSGSFPEAEAMVREVLASESARLGADHPQVLYTKKTLGQTLHRQGRLDEAVPFYAEVHDKRRAAYGDDHPLTLNSGAQLASAYNTLDRPAEAEPLLRRALAVREARGEGASVDAVVDRVMLVTTLDKLGRADEAMALADSVLAAEGGAPNRDTLAVRNSRAVLLLKSGRAAEARTAFGELLRLAPDVIGEQHPNFPVFLSGAAAADLALGDAVAAQAKLERALPMLQGKQGPMHLRTREAKARLADAYRALGREADAAALEAMP